MTEGLAINELVKQSGEMSRTIHYYIKEGLLPPPEGRGSRARYHPSCVLRLRLIRLLQRQHYMRLEGIREFMAPLTEDAIQAEIDRLEGGGPRPGPEQLRLAMRSRITAFDIGDEDMGQYVADALEAQTGGVAADKAVDMDADKATDKDADKDADTWTRVRITDDVEIHYRDGSRASRAEQLRRLITLARQILRRR